MSTSPDEKPQVAAPSLWPIGFAIGLASVLVGLVVSWPAVVVGAVMAIVFAALWIRDLTRPRAGAAPEHTAAEQGPYAPALAVEPETYGRGGFLSLATLGLGGVIGAGVTLPSLGFAVLPAFIGANVETKSVDLGPITNFPEGTFVIATFTQDPKQGDVSRRTAYIRNNGPAKNGEPSFTVIFNRCVHLGCPVQPNGPTFPDKKVVYRGATLTPVQPSGFGCPCHGAAYDNEGNRTAGPPVRSLDRFAFSIVNGNLVLGKPFSVGGVQGTGADARITRYRKAYPGMHVDGPERWLYPLPVPGS